MSLSFRQIDLIRKFDAEAAYMLEGSVAVMHTGGIGGRLEKFRSGREADRPPCVTLEPRRGGKLMLGLKISRPLHGKMTYEKVLGCWDFTAPIRRGGPLNEYKPKHRRAVSWGLQLLSGLIDTARRIRAGTGNLSTLVMPRVFIPFAPGTAQVDPVRRKMFPNAATDYQNFPGKELIDAVIAKDADIARAINDNTALEDFSPVLGQKVANPFYGVQVVRAADREIALRDIAADAPACVFTAVRKFLGCNLESGATDADIVAAAASPDTDMTLSRFSRVQVVPVEDLYALPAPYAGNLLPPPDWKSSKKMQALA